MATDSEPKAGRGMTDEEKVKQFEPSAYVRREGTLSIIARPRRLSDGKMLVPYVYIGGEEYTSDAAWKSAWTRFAGMRSHDIQERIAIKIDSHIPPAKAERQALQEWQEAQEKVTKQ